MKNWWLLASCGILNAMYAVMYLFMRAPDGSITLRTFAQIGTVRQMGMLGLAIGVCTIAAAQWNPRNGKSWLLMLNGLACGTLGSIFAFWKGPLAFRTIALLIAIMAMSIGIYELMIVRRHLAHEWLTSAAGVIACGFALAFLGFVFRWIKVEHQSPAQTFVWLGSFFAFTAICMLGLSLRQHRQ